MQLVQRSTDAVRHNRRHAVLWWLAATSAIATAWPAHAAKPASTAEQLQEVVPEGV